MKKIFIIVILIAAVGFGYYAISPLFNNIAVDDALPDNLVLDIEPVASGFEDLSKERQTEMLNQMVEINLKPTSVMDEGAPVEDKPSEMLFPVIGTSGHPASGQVRVLETTSGTVVRYEDFKTINGPRLHAYLAKDLKADDFIDLGPIKGTEGNINYTLPENVDVREYKYIMYWCVPFGVLFNYAEIN